MKIHHIYIAFAFLFCSLSLNAQSKIGTVNINIIVSKLPEFTQVQKQVQEYNSKLESDLRSKIEIYQSKLKEYQDNVKTLETVMKKTKEDELIRLETDINKFRQNGATMSQLKQEELMRPLYQKISDAIGVVAKAQKYTQVLTTDGNEFAYADEKFDLTKSVMSQLGVKE